MGKSLLPSHFAVNPKYAKKIKSQKHMKGKKGAHIASQSGKRQGRCPRCRSEGGGAGVLSTVLLRGWRGRGTVHGDFWRDRGQGLCPQCLEEWGLQGYCVHSTSHSGRGRGAVSTVPLTVGGRGGPVEPDPGPRPQEVQDLAMQHPARPTAQPPLSCELSCSPRLHLWYLFQKTCLPPPTLSPRLF